MGPVAALLKLKTLNDSPYNNLVGRSHKEIDLTDQVAVKKFFDDERPDAVVLAAAFVGGIMANSLYRADFIMMNMKIQCNVISVSAGRIKLRLKTESRNCLSGIKIV